MCLFCVYSRIYCLFWPLAFSFAGRSCAVAQHAFRPLLFFSQQTVEPYLIPWYKTYKYCCCPCCCMQYILLALPRLLLLCRSTVPSWSAHVYPRTTCCSLAAFYSFTSSTTICSVYILRSCRYEDDDDIKYGDTTANTAEAFAADQPYPAMPAAEARN